MSAQCSESIERLVNQLGFSCRHASPIMTIRNSTELSNWTLPFLELTVVAGAVLALWWAIRRLRRDGDPINLVIWFATVLYLLIVEPPLYFPTVFGVEDTIGAVFAHNVFTIDFMYDRLPLYIVALYPAMMMIAYEIVRSLGVFRDRGIVVGAVCVGFVHHCFYEVFDQLGPQWQWWTWNTDNAVNRPSLASVPMSSVLLFATVGPALVAFFAHLLVDRPRRKRHHFGWAALTLRTVVVAVLVPLGLMVFSIPVALAGTNPPDGPLRWAVYAAMLAAFAVVTLPALVDQLRRHRLDADTPNVFVRIYGTTFLVVLGALWIAALPAYISARGGITAAGTPTGSLVYAAVCFLLASAMTLSVSARPQRGPGQVSYPATSERHSEATP